MFIAEIPRTKRSVLRVHLRDLSGERGVNLQLWRTGKAPHGGAGFMVNFDAIPDLIDALDRALDEAERLGWVRFTDGGGNG
jgi:hypothetical protein